MKVNTNEVIQEVLGSTDKNAIKNAVNTLLSEDINSGDTVVNIDDDGAYPYQGVKGKCQGPSAKGSGFVDVRYPDGTVVPMQSSLLLRAN